MKAGYNNIPEFSFSNGKSIVVQKFYDYVHGVQMVVRIRTALRCDLKSLCATVRVEHSCSKRIFDGVRDSV